MAYPQTYSGTLRFGSEAILEAAAHSLTHPNCLVKLDQGRVDETTWRVEVEHEAPRSLWEPTVAILDSVSRLAAEGELRAVFHGDEDEIIYFEGGVGRVIEPTPPGQEPRPFHRRAQFRPWRVVELPEGAAMDHALKELERTFLRAGCMVARPGNGVERWVYTAHHSTYPALGFTPVGDRTVRVTRFEPPEGAVRRLAASLTWAVKRLGATWRRDEGAPEKGGA